MNYYVVDRKTIRQGQPWDLEKFGIHLQSSPSLCFRSSTSVGCDPLSHGLADRSCTGLSALTLSSRMNSYPGASRLFMTIHNLKSRVYGMSRPFGESQDIPNTILHRDKLEAYKDANFLTGGYRLCRCSVKTSK